MQDREFSNSFSTLSCKSFAPQSQKSIAVSHKIVSWPDPRIDPEVADLVWAAVQEMESLARNCILVEESYQRYFLGNCGTQKEEAAWRQQGIREEETARYAAKEFNHIHISELWARVGYYNNEAANRSNLFRLLLQEKRKIHRDCSLTTSKANATTAHLLSTIASHNNPPSDKRRRRPHQVALQSTEIRGPVSFADFLQAVAQSKAEDPRLSPSSLPLSLHNCRTALVHNPYSFDGPSQVSVEEESAAEPLEEVPSPAVPQSACGATVSPMGMVLKKALPSCTHQLQDVPRSLPELLREASTKDLEAMALPLREYAAKTKSIFRNGDSLKNAADSEGLSDVASSPESPDMYHNSKSFASNIRYPSAASNIHNSVPPAAESPEAAGAPADPQGSQKERKEISGRRPRKNEGRAPEAAPEAAPAEDHPLLLGPSCTHMKHWKRLRANRGFAYFICYHCGAKWRMSSRGMRTSAMAAAAFGPEGEDADED